MRARGVPLNAIRRLKTGGEAHGDGAHTEQRSLDGPRDRARIGDIVGHVGTAIDTRQHKRRPFLAQQIADRHDYTVGRGAAHGERLLANPAHADRLTQRQRVRRATLIQLGRDRPHVIGQGARDIAENFQARSSDAVIVGDQNAHLAPLSSRQVAGAIRTSPPM